MWGLDHETWRIPSFRGSIIYLSHPMEFLLSNFLIIRRVLLVIGLRGWKWRRRRIVTWTAWIKMGRKERIQIRNGRQPPIHNKWTSTPSIPSLFFSSDNPCSAKPDDMSQMNTRKDLSPMLEYTSMLDEQLTNPLTSHSQLGAALTNSLKFFHPFALSSLSSYTLSRAWFDISNSSSFFPRHSFSRITFVWSISEPRIRESWEKDNDLKDSACGQPKITHLLHFYYSLVSSCGPICKMYLFCS